jgi:heat shock protein HtpX
MAMLKRVFLFVATNIAVMLVLSITLPLIASFFGVRLDTNSLTGLIVIGGIVGFAGSFISLAMSKWMAKRATGAQVIETPRNATEQWLVDTVRRQAKQAGIGMPEVAVYQAPEINAFATGMNRDSALVAVSTGLLSSMDRDEAEAVLGHEVTHVANGDMITLALIQGVVNTFVFVLAHIVGRIIDNAIRGSRDDGEGAGGGIGFFVTTWIAQVVLGILASTIVFWFSRQREFRADRGGAKLAGRDKMVAALERLKRAHEPSTLPNQMAAFGISGGIGHGLKRLFMSHPPLEERIAALQQARM